MSIPVPTGVFDTYWRFAAERLAIYFRRQQGQQSAWTSDPILNSYRFTNTYRAADRISQYLIKEIQYNSDRSQEPEEIFFRTVLFKIFNKIETWELLESRHGPINWSDVRLESLDCTLSDLLARGNRIYSAAYIMPAPAFGAQRKHTNHLKLVAAMMEDRLAIRLQQAPSFEAVYASILRYRSLGPFLAFQYAIDLNYSALLNFNESDFVIAGPGALDGISKCFVSTGGLSPEQLIYWVASRQKEEFHARGIDFPGLFGRPLQPVDCQNLFCEISKYARVAHPEVTGIAKRVRIKQGYKRDNRPLPAPMFPPKWGLQVPQP